MKPVCCVNEPPVPAAHSVALPVRQKTDATPSVGVSSQFVRPSRHKSSGTTKRMQRENLSNHPEREPIEPARRRRRTPKRYPKWRFKHAGPCFSGRIPGPPAHAIRRSCWPPPVQATVACRAEHATCPQFRMTHDKCLVALLWPPGSGAHQISAPECVLADLVVRTSRPL